MTLTLLVLAWCAFAFRADLARIHVGQLWAARELVLFAAALSLLNYFLRALRWGYYFACLGHVLPPRFVGLAYVAGLAFTLVPGKVGEMTRAYYFQKAGVPVSASAATFLAERLLDLIVMVALASLGLVPGVAPGLVGIAAVSVLAALAALALLPWERAIIRASGSAWLPERARAPARGLARALESAMGLLRARPFAIGLALGLVAWGAEGYGLKVLAGLAPQTAIDWNTAIAIYAIALLAGALSFLPGGLGGTEAVMAALLAAQGYSMPDALMLTLLCRLLTLWLAIALGWAAVLWLGRDGLSRPSR